MVRDLNWRRGFLRLYAALTLAWIVFVGWAEWGLLSEILYLDPTCWRDRSGLRVACGLSLLEERLWSAALGRLAVPPVALLLFGLAGTWVARGFRQPA